MKQFIITTLSFFILIFAASCNEEGTTTPTTAHSVAGYFITDEGTPISNAIVEATDGEGKLFSTSTTNEAGNFEVSNIPENTENSIVSFVKDGTIIKQLKLNTLIKMSSKSNKTDILLGGEYDYDAVFAVKVVDKGTSEPIENAYVRLFTSDKAKFEAITDATGYAYLPQIVPGRYSIYIEHKDYMPHSDAWLLVFPEGTDTLPYTIPLTPKDSLNTGTGGGKDTNICCNNTINVTVVYAETKLPFANCEVQFLSGYNGTLTTKKTNANGIAIFEEVCTGRYSIYVNDNGYTASEGGIVICDANVNILLPVIKQRDTINEKCCDNTLIIHYKDKNGNPINCGYGELIETNGTGYKVVAPISNGKAIFDSSLCNGGHSFTTTIKGCEVTYSTASLYVGFTCKETLERTITLQEVPETPCCRNSISIELLDSMSGGKTIIDNAEVEIQQWENGRKTFSQKARFVNGAYIAEGLCTGKYAIRIVTPDGYVKEYTFEVICDDHIKRTFYF